MISGIISFVCFILGIVLSFYATENDNGIIIAFGLLLLIVSFTGIIIFIGTNIDTIIKYFKI